MRLRLPVRSLAIAMLSASLMFAQTGTGPDVIVGDLTGPQAFGVSGGIAAYSVGTDSCNNGTQVVQWQGGNNLHPVIGQNLYRLKGGHFEQIGMSWLKHGFTALANSLCFPCQNPGTGALLGVGCSDPYGSGLNGTQSNLGPRSEVNAATGVFLFPFGGAAGYDATIGRRLQAAVVDVDPTQNAGAVYAFEAQYVTQDDALAGNKNNNCSYRRATFNNNATFSSSFAASTVRMQSALYFWKAIDPAVTIQNVDIPGDGRFEVAYKVAPAGAGIYHYEFTVHNLSSDLSGQAFQVNFAAPTSITSPYFHDVNYHSGEPYDGTDWSTTTTPTSIKWETALWCANPNANALRWGTSYTFAFNASSATFSGYTITPFKPTASCPAQPTIPQVGSYSVNTNAPYTFTDISATGTAGPVGDDVSSTVTLGFTFPFFGGSLTQVKVSTNGYLCQTSSSGTVFNPTTFPNTSEPNGMIAGLWGDLLPNSAANGTVRYSTTGSAPNRQFIAQWTNVAHFSNTALRDTFQVVLKENGEILNTMVSTNSGSSGFTRGVENSTGTAGISSTGPYTGGTTWSYNYSTTVLPSADTYVLGSGAPNTNLTVRIVSTARQAPVILIADTNPGPTSLGALGNLPIGFVSPLVLADGAGVFAPADPAARTNCECGVFDWTFNTGPAGLPPGLTVYFGAVVIFNGSGPTPPNGQFHIAQQGVLNT